jgi:hypothetical protein
MRARYVKNPHLANFGRTLELDKQAMEDVLEACGVVFRRAERKLFQSEGASGGRKWKPLDPKYERWKTRFLRGALKEMRRENTQIARMTGRRTRTPGMKTANRILQLSGDMRDSFTNQGHEDHIEKTYRLRENVWKVEMGSKHELAKYHAGGNQHNTDLPVREPVMVTDKDRESYRRVIWRAFVPHVSRRIRAFAQLGFPARAA